MQTQSTAPGVGVNGLPGTRYYLQLNFASFAGAPEVVNNHIPLDPLNVNGRLQVEKTASANSVEVGDSLQYSIRVKNNGASPVNGLTIVDEPPAGFSLIDGTAILQIGAVRQGVVPVRTPGQRSFTVTVPGVVALGQEVTLTYYMRAGVGAAQGSGTNTVRVGLPGQPNLASDKVTVRVKGGVLGNDACLIGKVYIDSDGDRRDLGKQAQRGDRAVLVDHRRVAQGHLPQHRLLMSAQSIAPCGRHTRRLYFR
mgnify:CR=1 FL=1